MAAAFNPVVWFEIPVHDMKRSREFYEYVLDTRLELHDLGGLEMAWFPMVQGAPGTTGCLAKGESYVPSHEGTMIYLSVGDIEASLKRIVEKGGKVLNPKMSIGEHGFVAHFEDCEGNRAALHSTT